MTDSPQPPHGPHTFADKIFEINPYSKDDSRHETWESNARLAAEEEATFEAELLKRTPVTPEECARYVQDGMVGHFDILARRALIFEFRSAESIAIYQELLTGMMESMLTLAGENCSPMIPKAPFLFGLQRQFRQRIAHWTAEALKRMRADSAEKSLEPSEGTRADLEVAKDSTGIIESKKKRGPQANMEYHRAVAEVVHSFGPNWKEHLEQIARELDKRKRNLPPPTAWALKNPSARSWGRAVEHYPDLVLKKLAYSLKMAPRDTTGETFANSR